MRCLTVYTPLKPITQNAVLNGDSVLYQSTLGMFINAFEFLLLHYLSSA